MMSTRSRGEVDQRGRSIFLAGSSALTDFSFTEVVARLRPDKISLCASLILSEPHVLVNAPRLAAAADPLAGGVEAGAGPWRIERRVWAATARHRLEHLRHLREGVVIDAAVVLEVAAARLLEGHARRPVG